MLTRSNHDANLDGMMENALSIVVQFVLSLCGTSRENLLLDNYESFDKIIELPVTQNTLSSDEMTVLHPVLNHLALALTKTEVSRGSKRESSDAEIIWEQEMRRWALLTIIPAAVLSI